MALSGYRRGWLKQPSDGVGPSQGEIGRDILTLIHGGSPAVDLVSGGILSQAGGVIPLEATQYGTAYSNSGSALSAINAGPNVDGKELTFLALARPSSTSTTTVAIGGYGKSTDADTLGFIGQGGSAGQLRFWMRNDATSVSQDLTASGSSAGWANGAWSVVIGRRSESGNVRSLWCNGVELATATCPALGTWTPDRTAIFGLRRTTDALVWNGSLALFAAWGRSLSDNEARALSQNPWQLFQPRRIWVPVSAGGGGGAIYTIIPSGGVSFAGINTTIKSRVFNASGTLSLAGTTNAVHEKTQLAVGGIVYSGTAPLTLTNGATTYTINPSGSITYSGSAAEIKTKTFAPSGAINFNGTNAVVKNNVYAISGGVTLSGSAPLSFIPFGSVTVTTRLPLTGVGQ